MAWGCNCFGAADKANGALSILQLTAAAIIAEGPMQVNKRSRWSVRVPECWGPLASEKPEVERPAEGAIGMFLVLSEVSFLDQATTLRNPTAA